MGSSKTLKWSGIRESGMVAKSGQATARMAEGSVNGTGQAMATKSGGNEEGTKGLPGCMKKPVFHERPVSL